MAISVNEERQSKCRVLTATTTKALGHLAWSSSPVSRKGDVFGSKASARVLMGVRSDLKHRSLGVTASGGRTGPVCPGWTLQRREVSTSPIVTFGERAHVVGLIITVNRWSLLVIVWVATSVSVDECAGGWASVVLPVQAVALVAVLCDHTAVLEVGVISCEQPVLGQAEEQKARHHYHHPKQSCQGTCTSHQPGSSTYGESTHTQVEV